MRPVDRRTLSRGLLVAGLALPLAWARSRPASAEPTIKKAKDLKPGEFTWHPERSPVGYVAIVVSIPDQRVHVYRNGIRIGVSTCSTGKPGHATPTGVFIILEKDKNHHSSTYNNAPMPNMNRLTWGGIALHAGNLPGYPASHGCIRLPMKFSAALFEVTKVGTAVIIAGSHDDPKEIVHPGLILGSYAQKEFSTVKQAMKREKLPWQADVATGDSTTAILVSHADMTITLMENGSPLRQGHATIDAPEQPLGRHVFMLSGTNGARQGLSWHALSHHDAENVSLADASDKVLRRIHADQPMLNAISDRMHPGMLLITTELPATPDTRTGDDFVLMNTDEV